MPTNRSMNELQELAARHTAHEFSNDIDALMATVHPNPCWIYEPIGCEITTPAAVSEMYQRMFPVIAGIKQMPVVNMWFADDGFIGEVKLTRTMPDETEAAVSQFTWCEFNGDLMSGECSYVDAGDVVFLAHILGESFFKLPGVNVTSPLEWASDD